MSSNSHHDNSSSDGKKHATANDNSNEAGTSANAHNRANVNNTRSVDPPDSTSSRIQQPQHQPYNDKDWSSVLDYKAQVNSRSVIRVVPPASTSTRDPPEGRSNNSSNVPELDYKA